MKKFIKNNWLLLLITIQPVLDSIYYFQIIKNMTPITWVIRMIILALTIGTLFISSKKKKKLILYILPFVVYYILHIINLYRIDSLNLILDTKYYLYVFELPILSILLIDYIKNHKEQLDKIKKGLFISYIIICTNLLLAFITKTYQCTYELNGECVGILGWFAASDTVFLIICALAPWTMNYSLNNHNIFVYSLFSLISYMTMFTNASKSCYYTLVFTLVLLIYNNIVGKNIKHKKMKLGINILLLALSIVCYNSSFTFYKEKISKTVLDNNQSILNEIKNSNNNIKEKDKQIEKKSEEEIKKDIEILNTSYIYRELIEIHGADAVLNAMQDNINSKTLMDNRYRKKINAKIEYNKTDFITKVLGFGYSKIAKNNLDLENDLTAIFYFYGFAGFGLYISIFLFFLYKSLKSLITNFKLLFDNEFITINFLILLLVAAGEYSGAFLRKPNANIYLVMYLVILYYKCQKYKSKNKEIEMKS